MSNTLKGSLNCQVTIQKTTAKESSMRCRKLYVKRWLICSYQLSDGSCIERQQGIPQGSVIGPLLANLFLHYVFDQWMKREYGDVPFERYADDIICHCPTRWKSEEVLSSIKNRLRACRLEPNEDKTRIVYCKDSNRKYEYRVIQFDFLGYTFRP